LPGETVFNSSDVQNYPSFQAGALATAKTLEEPRYSAVVANLNSSPAAFDAAVTSSPWGTHDLTPAVRPINKDIVTRPGGEKKPVSQLQGQTQAIHFKWYEPWTWDATATAYVERAFAIIVGIVVVIVGIKILFGDSPSEAIKSTAQAPAKITEKYGTDAAEIAA
jgi:hypothetical protein